MTSVQAATVLLIPGYTNSGAGHWQTLWQKNNPDYKRVEQDDWDKPTPEAWTRGIQKAVEKISGSILMVGHSCGAVAVVQWAARYDTQKVVAALLVSPGDVDEPDAIPEIRPLGPMPTNRLLSPTVLITSDNDPHMRLERAKHFAEVWGSRLVVVERAEHINTAAGYGPWPFGETVLRELAREVDVQLK